MAIIYIAIMVFIGMIIGGFAAGNNTLGIVGIVGTVILSIVGITIRYLNDRQNRTNEQKNAYDTYFKENATTQTSLSKKPSVFKFEQSICDNESNDKVIDLDIINTLSEQKKATNSTNENWEETLAQYFTDKGFECKIVGVQNKQIFVTYCMDYIWAIGININQPEKYINVYVPVFKINEKHFNDVYELINEYNQKCLFAKFICDKIESDKYVIAEYDIPLVKKTVIGDYCADRIKQFIETIEAIFREIPKDFLTI